MWLPPRTVTAPAVEPLAAQDVRDYLRIDGSEYDPQIAIWIAGARSSVEALTATRLINQTVELRASSFDDLERLPIGPVAVVTGIAYLDSTGAAQQLSPGLYQQFGAGLAIGVRPLGQAAWPATTAADDAIVVTATVGYGADGTAIPGAVRIALLQLVRGLMKGADVDVTGWLANDRIWL